MQNLWHAENFNRHYNCTFYDYNSIPVDSRRNFLTGILLLLLYVLFELLYLPCLGVLARKENRREHCFKLMLFMGILSMVNLHSSGLIIGIYAIRGDVFCSRPLFNYAIGITAYGFFCSEAMVSVLLALNRCIEMWNPRIGQKLFGQQKIYFWMAATILYGFMLGFLIPPIPNGMMVGWFWNPHIAYAEDPEGVYLSIQFPIHNICVGVGLPLIYALFYLLMRNKIKMVENEQQSKELRKSKVNVFIQVMLISVLHMFVTLLYVYMQYFPVPIWMPMSVSFAWIISQGLIPVIYIVFNKHIRRNIHFLFVQPFLMCLTTCCAFYRNPNSVMPISTATGALKNTNNNHQTTNNQ